MEIKRVMGLTLDQIAWMKRYFIEKMIPIHPSIECKCSECQEITYIQGL